MGLRVSAPGVDAFSGLGIGGDFTFNSAWTDISKIHQVGLATYSSANITVIWTSLGYRPFVEIRRRDGNVVRDDWFSSTFASGGYFVLDTINSFHNTVGSTGLTIIYIVYAIPVPSG